MKEKDYESHIVTLKRSIDLLKTEYKEEIAHAEGKAKRLEEEIIQLKSEQWRGEGLKKVKFGMDQIVVKSGAGHEGLIKRGPTKEYMDNMARFKGIVTNYRKSISGANGLLKAPTINPKSSLEEGMTEERPRVYSGFVSGSALRKTSNETPNSVPRHLPKDVIESVQDGEDEYHSLKISEDSRALGAVDPEPYRAMSVDEDNAENAIKRMRTDRRSGQFEIRVVDFQTASEATSLMSEVIDRVVYDEPSRPTRERCSSFLCFLRCLLVYLFLGRMFRRSKMTL
jgi:predicted nucleic acid-binding protein